MLGHSNFGYSYIIYTNQDLVQRDFDKKIVWFFRLSSDNEKFRNPF